STPGPTITWFEFSNPQGSDFTMQPAHTFGTPGAEYFLFEGSPDHLGVAWMDNTSGTPVWHAPLQVPVTHYASTGFLPDAPQLATAVRISTSDTRLLNAVYRNGSVWTVHTVQSPTAVRTEVAWYRINPVAGAFLAQGRVNDPNRWYYYPSIGVNKDNVAAVGFSGSSTTEYAGGYYTLIQPSTGAAEPVALLKTGEAPYSKTLGGSENRWGDFSATMVDPVDDVTFWTLQEYAMTPDTFIDINNNVVDRSRWGTWWGKFTPGTAQAPPLPPPPPPPPPPLGGGGGGGGGGCLSINRSGGEVPFGTALFSVGILLLPTCALGLRRFFRRRERTVPIRHPLC
ncbi:MAG: hypothetical protein Q8O78_03955, partial [Candidatus Deferrimicrobium sp.]|nr:hypothetical protein [Candidatus Deferrimicrobium sp.]